MIVLIDFRLQGKYGNLDSALISFGPCQTPTLGFCVDRHDKIQSFQPEPYWVLMVNVGIPGGPNLQLDWDKGREFNQNTAKSIMNKVKSSKKAVITHITKKDKVKARVGALNTVEMLRVASSGLAIGPHQAMSIAERLYTQGFISYPRTETNQYPANFDLVGTLRVFRSHEDYGSAVDLVLNKGVVRPKSGHDAGDHPPITPMKTASMNTFSDRDSWRLYDYIVRHFIGSLSGDCKYEQTTVHLLIGDEKFSKTGCIVLDPGFTEVMPWLAMANDERLPASIKTGDEFLIGETRLDERLTSPPDYLSESDLISLMEKHGIGTDASIPTHINNICVRNYVKISSGRRLIPTKLGIVLIHGYQKIDNHLVLPTRRAEIEKRLNQIAAGTADFHQVLSSTLAEFRTKFDNFVTNIAAMDELFEVSFSSLAESGKALSRCGKCRRYLKLITAKPVRLYCPNCQETLSLPHNGSFRTFKELKCPLDEYELLYFNGFGANSKSYVLCPNCYNNPPFEDMKKLSGCNQCSNKECPQSMIHLGIGDCRWCTWEGTLTLDPGSGHGGKWKIYCNKCDSFMTGLKEAVKVTVKNDKCSSCKSKTIHVEYKRERNPNESHGCVFCTPEVSQGLVSIPGKSARGRGGLTGQQNAGPGGHKVLGNRQIHQNNDPREGGDNFQRGGQQFNPQGGLDNGHFDGGRGGGGGFRGGRGKFNNRGGGGRGGRGGDDDEDDDDGSGYGGRGGYSSGGRGGSRGGGRGGGRGGRGRGGGRGGRGRGRGRGGRDSDNDYAPTPSGSLRLSDFL